MINAILIDDEPGALNVLKNKLIRFCPEINIIATANSAEEGFDLIVEKRPHLLFLDVAMPVKTGFDLLSQLPSLDFEVIFVTGFNNYAIEAFKFSAIGYIVKPIESSELIKTVNLAKERINQKIENKRNRQLLNNISSSNSQDNKIGIPMMEGLEFIAVKDIIRCEGLQRCTRVVIQNRKAIISSYNLGEFVKLLTPYGFYAPHRSHLINLSHIQKYHKEGTITLVDNSHVPVSRRKKQEFLEQLKLL